MIQQALLQIRLKCGETCDVLGGDGSKGGQLYDPIICRLAIPQCGLDTRLVEVHPTTQIIVFVVMLVCSRNGLR